MLHVDGCEHAERGALGSVVERGEVPAAAVAMEVRPGAAAVIPSSVRKDQSISRMIAV